MNLKKNPELIPLIDWWKKDGKTTVLCLVVAVVAFFGYKGWQAKRAATRAEASAALINAEAVEDLENAVSKFEGAKAEGAIQLRLAKGYFDAGRFDDALAKYEEMAGKEPDGFEGIPAVGKAHCLEAKGQFAEAQKLFDEFVAANPESYLLLTAQLGSARVQAQAGDKTGALDKLAQLKSAAKDDAVAVARIDATEIAIKRLVDKK